jgi:putative N-acetylmannosamine-6-phosphate epimerase
MGITHLSILGGHPAVNVVSIPENSLLMTCVFIGLPILAAGASPTPEAVQHIRRQGVRAIVRGASSRERMQSSFALVNESI